MEAKVVGIGGEDKADLLIARSRSSAKALSKGEMSIIWDLCELEVVEVELKEGEVEGG